MIVGLMGRGFSLNPNEFDMLTEVPLGVQIGAGKHVILLQHPSEFAKVSALHSSATSKKAAVQGPASIVIVEIGPETDCHISTL